jgi:hypothetical protein
MWLPHRGNSRIHSAVATRAPSGAPNSALPSAPSESLNSLFTCGMWATHDEKTRACAANTAVTQIRARSIDFATFTVLPSGCSTLRRHLDSVRGSREGGAS